MFSIMRVLFLIGSFILFVKLHYIQSGLNSKIWEETNESDRRKLHDKFIDMTLLFDEVFGGNKDL
jgi:Na+/pantothenate symporter